MQPRGPDGCLGRQGALQVGEHLGSGQSLTDAFCSAWNRNLWKQRDGHPTASELCTTSRSFFLSQEKGTAIGASEMGSDTRTG